MGSIVRKGGVIVIVVLAVMLGINVERMLGMREEVREWEYEYIQLEVQYKQTSDHSTSTPSSPGESTHQTANALLQSITLTKQGQLCLNTHQSPHCTHTPFINTQLIKTNQTQNYYILQTPSHYIAILKDQPLSDHLRYISKSKDQHMPSKQASTYFNIPDSDYFIFQWSKLYIVYKVEDHSIEKRLFLEKTSRNYTQHWIRAQNDDLTLLSFPNRNQIMLQVYNSKTNKVPFMSKIPIDGWISKHSYRLEEGKLVIDLETEENLMNYVFDQGLAIETESKEKKLDISEDVLKFKSPYTTTAQTDYLKLIQNLACSTFSYLKKRLSEQKPSAPFPKPYSYNYLKFYKQNRYYVYDFLTSEFNTVSLGKYLIPTGTPVFHNIDNNSLQDEQSKQRNQPVHYIEKGALKSEEYMSIFEVYPKYEAEWVGLTKGFINFYPNKQNPGLRFARTPNGVVVFDGMKFKGVWKETVKSDYETVQYLNRKPEELSDGFVEGHYFFTGMIGIIELDENGFSKAVHFFTGFNGKRMHLQKLEGHHPDDIFLNIENNDIIISCYLPEEKKSRITKIQLYSESKNYGFLMIRREYQIKNRVINIGRYVNNYYFTLTNSQGIVLCNSKTNEFNNRRPLITSKPSSFEQKIILQELRGYEELQELDVRCIEVEKGGSFETGRKVNEMFPLGYHSVVNQRQGGTERFLVFDVVNLLDNRAKQAASESRTEKVKTIIAACAQGILLIVVWLVGSGKKQTVVREEGTVDKQEPSKPNKKKKKNE